VNASGESREPYLDRLKRLVAECDRRGLIVDVTLTRGAESAPGRIPDLDAHQQAVTTLVQELQGFRNWYLDLANERDVGDARFVAIAEIKQLRDLVRRLDPSRLVTASFGGHDLDEGDLRDAILAANLDFLCPHRPRTPESPGQTEAHTRDCLAKMTELGRVVPVHYQEPFRRGYTGWEPTAADFLADLRGALNGGAAGWCLHNGSDRKSDDGQPRRSFDLRTRSLFDQLDDEEKSAVSQAAAVVRAGHAP
jgi:hypothetical protein